jgi:hypothetical protein
MRQELTVAVATLSGSAYYKLTEELKKKKIDFISLNPNSKIPVYINLILTTKEEHHLLHHPNIVIYDESEDIANVVDLAVQTTHRTQEVRRLIVGVDPGKSWGVSAVADGTLLHSGGYTSMKEVEEEIQNLIAKVTAKEYVVKIGNGSEPHHSQLISSLNRVLPRKVIIESVREEGTSSNILWKRKEDRIDAISAELICSRRGKRIARKATT